MMAPAATPQPVIIQWIIDTRNLWPEVTETRQLETFAGSACALALLPQPERAGVLKYVFARDAKMSLASHLLKHYVVARHSPGGGVPWAETHLTRDERTKPVYVDPATGAQPVAFNVSHQAGVVALAGVAGYDPEQPGGGVEVGVDVVCTSERRGRDHALVREEGWVKFVDMHSDVFAPGEAAFLKYECLGAVGRRAGSAPSSGPAGSTQAEILDYKLRCFYTLWCLREAYVKMTGDALLAEWLRELEFRNFRPPTSPAGLADVDVEDLGLSAEEEKEGGREETTTPGAVTEHEIWFRGARVEDANVCLRSLGPDYMICTAVRTPGRREDGLAFELGPFEVVTVDEIVEFAEASRR